MRDTNADLIALMSRSEKTASICAAIIVAEMSSTALTPLVFLA